jgi:hypothetical protein
MSAAVALPKAMFPWIFRKDLRVLWPLAVASAVGQVLLAALLHHIDPFSVSDETSAVAALVTLALMISMVLLMVLAVQQDPLPGVTQDWLVRPIRRWDLLLAKLLTVVLFIQAPIAVVKLVEGLAEGFPLGPLLGAVFLSNCKVALVFSLPVVVVASLTRSVGEAVLGALAVFFGLIVVRLLMLAVLYPFTRSFDFFGSAQETGVAWVWWTLGDLELLGVIIAVLGMQFFRRSTARSRVVFVVGMAVFMWITELPWGPAFAIQQWVTPAGTGAQSTAIAFDPAAQSAQVGGELFTNESGKDKSGDAGKNKGGAAGRRSIALPLRVSGVPDGTVLHVDRTAVRVVSSSGKTLYRGTARVFDVRGPGGLIQQTVQISKPVYERITAQGQDAHVELDYSLTLLRVRTVRLPTSGDAGATVANGDMATTEVGHCATRIDSAGNAVQVACRQVGVLPACLSATLQQPDGVTRNPERFECEFSYEPANLRFATEPIDHFQLTLPFHEPTGVAHYAIGPDQVKGAEVVLRVYEPEGHFTRKVVIPHIPPPA